MSEMHGPCKQCKISDYNLANDGMVIKQQTSAAQHKFTVSNYCKIINFRGTFNFVYFVGKENPRNLMSAKLFISYTFVIFL